MLTQILTNLTIIWTNTVLKPNKSFHRNQKQPTGVPSEKHYFKFQLTIKEYQNFKKRNLNLNTVTKIQVVNRNKEDY